MNPKKHPFDMELTNEQATMMIVCRTHFMREKKKSSIPNKLRSEYHNRKFWKWNFFFIYFILARHTIDNMHSLIYAVATGLCILSSLDSNYYYNIFFCFFQFRLSFSLWHLVVIYRFKMRAFFPIHVRYDFNQTSRILIVSFLLRCV